MPSGSPAPRRVALRALRARRASRALFPQRASAPVVDNQQQPTNPLRWLSTARRALWVQPQPDRQVVRALPARRVRRVRHAWQARPTWQVRPGSVGFAPPLPRACRASTCGRSVRSRGLCLSGQRRRCCSRSSTSLWLRPRGGCAAPRALRAPWLLCALWAPRAPHALRILHALHALRVVQAVRAPRAVRLRRARRTRRVRQA